MWKIGKEEKSCVCSQGPVLLWKKCRFCLLSVTNMMNEKQTREQRQDSHVLVTHLSFSYMHTISSSRDGLPLAFIRFLFMLINQNHVFFCWLISVFWKSSCRRLWKGYWGEADEKGGCWTTAGLFAFLNSSKIFKVLSQEGFERVETRGVYYTVWRGGREPGISRDFAVSLVKLKTITFLMSPCPVKIKVTVFLEKEEKYKGWVLMKKFQPPRTGRSTTKEGGRGGEEEKGKLEDTVGRQNIELEGKLEHYKGLEEVMLQWHPSQKRKKGSSGSRSSQKPAQLSPRGEQGFSGCSDKSSKGPAESSSSSSHHVRRKKMRQQNRSNKKR